MRLFKTDMMFMPASPAATRPRYGGRGPRAGRMPTADRSAASSAAICILHPADPEHCACRRRNAAWRPACGEIDRAA